MNKGVLVEQMAIRSGLTEKQALTALNEFIKVTVKSLKRGEKVKLVDFGTFMIAKRAERKGRHPKNGDPIIIEARRVVRFKPGGALASRLQK